MQIVKRGGKDGTLGQTYLGNSMGPMVPFTRTLAVRFMNREDCHSVK